MILITLAVAVGSTVKGDVIHKQANINNTHGHDKWNLWWQAASFAIHDTGFSVALCLALRVARCFAQM